MNNLKLIHKGSLGITDSVIEHPATMTHAIVPEDVKELFDIHPGLIRFSVGIEDSKDIINDQEALDSLLEED